VDESNRYQAIELPDVTDMKLQHSTGTLSYTIATYEQVASIILQNDDENNDEGTDDDNDNSNQRLVDAVVTCFFLDTATNIYDWVALTHGIVTPGGVWINVGPLQWHRNARLPVTANQLRMIMERMGWDILEWNIDRDPIEYRSSQQRSTMTGQSETMSTHFDAYCPLRFVARKL